MGALTLGAQAKLDRELLCERRQRRMRWKNRKLKAGGVQFTLKGAVMDTSLMELRKRAVETSTIFLKAQSSYLKAAAPDSRKSEVELKEAAEEYCKATGPYDAALQELREYLLTSEPSEAITSELERTERLIKTLEHEKEIGSKLIKHHDYLITNDVRSTSLAPRWKRNEYGS